MKRIGLSFSSLFSQSFLGRVDLLFDELHFSAAREHVIRTDGHVPCEAKWLTSHSPAVNVVDDWVRTKDLDIPVIEHWMRFKRIAELKAFQKKAFFSVGKKTGLLAHAKALKLLGHEVWLDHWIDLDEMKYIDPCLGFLPNDGRCTVCGFDLEADDIICPMCGR